LLHIKWLGFPTVEDQSEILSPFPHCQHTLQFNPFFAAADDYAEVLRAAERMKEEL
jgi:hypothetical protein